MNTKIKILVVDDDHALRKTLSDILRYKGYIPADAAGGKTALAELKKTKPAVALIDLKLPDMDGLELIQEVRKHSPSTQCIVLTGHASQASAIEAVNLGAYSYVQKPYDVDQLLLTIRRAVEKREAEEALRESEEVYRTLVKTAPDSVIATDLQGHITFVSQRTLELHGYEIAEELIGRSIFELMALEDREGATANLQKSLKEGVVRDLEYTFLKKDGSHFTGELSIALIKDAYGKPKALMTTARDITARKQRERELKALSELAAALRTANTRSEIITVIMDEVLQLLTANSAALVLCDALTINNLAKDAMLVEQGRGAWIHTTGQIVSAGDCILKKAAVISPSKPHSPARPASKLSLPDIFRGHAVVACTPLLAQSQTIGAILVGREEEISKEEIRLLSAIGDMAASAIHRASLFEQTQLRLQRLASLRIVDMSISGSMDLRIALNVLLDQLTAQLTVAAACISLFHPSSQILEYVVGRGFRTKAIPWSRQHTAEGAANQAVVERRIVYIADLANREADRGTGSGSEPATGTAAENTAKFLQERGLAGEEFTAYHAVPLVVKGQVKGVLELFHRSTPPLDSEWLDFLETMAGQAAIAIDNAILFEGLERSKTELELAYNSTLEGWVRTLDMRDQEIEGHTRRVTDMTMSLARAMGLHEDSLIRMRQGALLHDIGKMAIPDAILNKPGPLTEDEWQIMRRHPNYAFDLLMPITYLHPAIEIPYCHHELWNGTGYPRGLKGTSIPLAARIFTVADVWDALQYDRPYRKGWPTEKIIEYFQHESGLLYDPDVVSAFLHLIES